MTNQIDKKKERKKRICRAGSWFNSPVADWIEMCALQSIVEAGEHHSAGAKFKQTS